MKERKKKFEENESIFFHVNILVAATASEPKSFQSQIDERKEIYLEVSGGHPG